MSTVLLGPHWAVWMIVLPLLSACAAFARPAWGRLLGGLNAGVMPLAVALLGWSLWQLGPLHHALGGWDAPLGIALRADGLAVILLAAAAIVGLAVSCYSLGYFGKAQGGRYFWPLWLLLWGALNALFLSADIFNLYVCLELMTLAAVALTALAAQPVALSAAMRYLFTGLLGSLCYLLGVALLYGAYGVVDLRLLAGLIDPSPPATAALALMTTGLLLKTALFPLHFWLPAAHAHAPAPVSALLSALVVKGSFAILLRLWFEVFPGLALEAAAQLLGALGAVAILWGSWQALRQRRLKLLVAYSTVAQLGYLFLVFPLARGAAALDAWSGAVLFILAHACGKAAMFLVAGAIQHSAGHDRIENLAGAGGPLGVQVVIFALAALTIIGLPPSGGFMAKWLLLSAAVASGQWWYLLVIVAGSLLAAAYVLRVLSWAFLRMAPTTVIHPLPPLVNWTPLALALLALLLGLAAFVPLRLAEIGAPFARLAAGGGLP